MLEWCKNCQNLNPDPDRFNLICLQCKWQYVGQEAFDLKKDLFEPMDNNDMSPTKYFGSALEWIGCEIL